MSNTAVSIHLHFTSSKSSCFSTGLFCHVARGMKRKKLIKQTVFIFLFFRLYDSSTQGIPQYLPKVHVNYRLLTEAVSPYELAL